MADLQISIPLDDVRNLSAERLGELVKAAATEVVSTLPDIWGQPIEPHPHYKGTAFTANGAVPMPNGGCGECGHPPDHPLHVN